MNVNAPRPSSPRIEPLTDLSGEAAEVAATTILKPDGTPLNIFGVLAKHPKLLKRFNLLGGFLLNKGLVPEREREIVILRVGWNARAPYEFGQHTAIGRRCGLSDDEIRRLASDDPGKWPDHELDLIIMVDELCDDDCVGDETFGRLLARWSEAEVIELVVCAGFYRMVSGFLNTIGVELDDGVPEAPWT
ncbi:MAG: carboxymuconolactone decarboxylase family protein [Acidimicrobiales bacterium]